MKHFEIAKREIGVKEIIGNDHNPRVVMYAKEIGMGWVGDDETAWCASFVGYCLKKAGMPYLKTLKARDYLNYGVEVKEPMEGDIAVLWRIKKNSPYGHVGFLFGYNYEGDILLLSGNSNNKVEINTFPQSRLLGFRRPQTTRKKLKLTDKQKLLLIKRIIEL